ncbi:MAG: ATP-binding protein [Syntrophobacteraceae bacterium]|nr:ATP-binding protein [Syntrophobacteraceae bacterium]
MKIFQFILTTLLVLTLCGCAADKESQPIARHGILDLGGWSLSRNGPVRLDGEWEIYWGRLLTPADFKGPHAQVVARYARLPSAWNGLESSGTKLGATGYATLRLRLNHLAATNDLSLRLFNIHSAYALWVDGRAFARRGVVGKTAGQEVPDPSVLIRQFQSTGKPVELVLQVSNFHDREGGVVSSIRLGLMDSILAEQLRHWGTSLFFIGCLLVMGLYHLFLYFCRRKNFAPLYFGLYCLLWMGNTAASESSGWVIRLIFPDGSTGVLETASLTCFFLSVPVGYRFFRSLYPDEFSVRVLRFSEVMAAIFLVCALLFPLSALSAILPVYYFTSFLLIVYSLVMLARAGKKGRAEANLFVAGFFILGLSGVNDMLFDLQVVRSIYLIQIGMFVFILCQAFALSLRFSRAFATAEQLSEQLRENNLTLSRMDQAKDEFLANTSHELRTPLTGIIGLSESLLDGVAGGLPPKALQDISMVAASARRLAGLVDDILDFTLLKNQEIVLKRKPVDLHSLADVALAMIEPLAVSKGIQTVNEISAHAPCADGDEDRLMQIFTNLIGNALKFTERGEVRISAHCEGEFIEIAFSDTGRSIPVEHIETIFLPFEQVDSSSTRGAGGVGLGLAISRNLAELHGGRLWAESLPGEGSIFHLRLPICRELAPPTETTDSKEPPKWFGGLDTASTRAAKARGGNGLQNHDSGFEHAGNGRHLPVCVASPGAARVLAVDDDPVNRRVIRNHLELQGMVVTTAADGREAIALLERDRCFDIVLLDVMMPGMTGFEVCRRLRTLHSLTELPVIMLTARNRISDLVEGMDSGANDYLGKPFTKDQLMARMRVQLKLLEAREQARSKGRLAMLGELAASIAHEVNTPINTIINSSELILLAENRRELEHDAMIIKDEGRRIAGILGGLLSFARRGNAEKTSCRIAPIVSDTLRLIGAKLRKEQIGLLVDIPESLPCISANAQQIMQVFLNLVNNAAYALHDKFPDGHDHKTINITGEQVDATCGLMVRMIIQDNGIGIPARRLEEVTKPFFTTKPVGKGAGLGLSVARGIIDDHGGRLRIESVEGEFTKVSVELPAESQHSTLSGERSGSER